MVDNSRFRDRIETLVNNPHVSSNVLYEHAPGKHLTPNCWGTSTCVLDSGENVKKLWVDSGKKLDDYDGVFGNTICIPYSDSPGYVGEAPMSLFLKTLEGCGEEPVSVISFSWDVL